MASKSYSYPVDNGHDYQPDLEDNANIEAAFSGFVTGLNSLLVTIGEDITSIDNKVDGSGTSTLTVPAAAFKLSGSSQSILAKIVLGHSSSTEQSYTLPIESTTLVGTTTTQTLSNKTISGGTINSNIDASGASISMAGTGTISSPIISNPSISNPTITGSITGNQDFNNNVNIDGTLTVGSTLSAGATNVSSLTVNGLTIESGYIPIPGMIVMYNGSTAPTGWAICDGTNGTPDLRDKFIIGASTTKALGTAGGGVTTSASGSHGHSTNAVSAGYTTNATNTDHYHSTNIATFNSGGDGSHGHTDTSGGPSGTFSFKFASGNLNTGGIPNSGHTHYVSVGAAGYHSHSINPGETGSNVGGSYHSHSGSITTNAGSANAGGDHTHTITPTYYALTYIMKL